MQLSASNNGSNQYSPTGWKDTNNGGGSIGTWLFVTSASANQPVSSSFKVGIVRDIQFTDTITYEDGSKSICTTGTAFLPDSACPNFAGTTNSTTVQNGSVYSTTDEPSISVSPRERPYVVEVRETCTARNFLVVDSGDGNQRGVSQVNWSYTIAVEFNSSSMSTGSQHFPTRRDLARDSKAPIPSVSSSIAGISPTDQPVTVNRDSNATIQYINNNANWAATGPQNSMAHIYSRNP